MTEFDPHAYSIQISTETIDGEYLFKAIVKELPDVLALGATYVEAYEEAIDAVKGIYEACVEEGKIFPDPIKIEEDYTGRVTLRMEKSLHRVAAQLAEAEGTSLNNLIATALASRVARGHEPRTNHSGSVKTVIYSTFEAVCNALPVSSKSAHRLQIMVTEMMTPMFLGVQGGDKKTVAAAGKMLVYDKSLSSQTTSNSILWGT